MLLSKDAELTAVDILKILDFANSKLKKMLFTRLENKLYAQSNEDPNYINNLAVKAAEIGSISACLYLLGEEELPIPIVKQMFITAAKNGHLKIVEYLSQLLPKDYNYNTFNEAAIQCVMNKHVPVFVYLLNIGAKIDRQKTVVIKKIKKMFPQCNTSSAIKDVYKFYKIKFIENDPVHQTTLEQILLLCQPQTYSCQLPTHPQSFFTRPRRRSLSEAKSCGERPRTRSF